MKAENESLENRAERKALERRDLEAKLLELKRRRAEVNSQNIGFDCQMENHSLIAECLREEVRDLKKN